MRIETIEGTSVARSGRRTNDGGVALFALLGMILIIGAGTGYMLWTSSANAHTTHRHLVSTDAFNAAEAAINQGVLILDMTDDWLSLTNDYPAIIPLTNMTGTTEYELIITNIQPKLATLIGRGRSAFRDGHITRRVQVLYGKQLPKAFSFAMFANSIRFHNHHKQLMALTIQTDMWSNSDISIPAGVTISGIVTAVDTIDPAGGGGGLPDPVLLGTFRDGDPDSPYYAPNFGDPVPEVEPIPAYNWDRVKQIAQKNGTYFASSGDFEDYLADPTKVMIQTFAPKAQYEFPSPLPSDPNRTITLGLDEGTDPGVSKITVASGVFYVEGSIDIDHDEDELIVFTNAALICAGGFSITGPTEIYALPTEPAIACDGSLGIKGGGGPAHIRGVIYAVESSHIHQSDAYSAVYIGGTELADSIHHCEYFYFEYIPWPDLIGFETADNSIKGLHRWREITGE